MGVLRIYRDIYKIDFDAVTGETYALINAYNITAASFITNSINVIENLVPTLESVGTYYVELNPILYTFNDIYEIKWSVKYTSSAPTKILVTKFKMNPANINSEIISEMIIDVIDNKIVLELENKPIIIEINDAT